MIAKRLPQAVSNKLVGEGSNFFCVCGCISEVSWFVSGGGGVASDQGCYDIHRQNKASAMIFIDYPLAQTDHMSQYCSTVWTTHYGLQTDI